MHALHVGALALVLAGHVFAAGRPMAGATVTLWSAGPAAPHALARTRTARDGSFTLRDPRAPGGVRYLIARGPRREVALLAVLGERPPARVVLDELTTVAAAWTNAQFLAGDALRGPTLGLRIAANNGPNLVDPSTGGYGGVVQDGLNSTQTTTLATMGTLANLLAGCTANVREDACNALFAAATAPGAAAPRDTLEAAEAIAQHPWDRPGALFALFASLYPAPNGTTLRPVPFEPYLTFAPSAWVLALKFSGGGLSAPGKLMFDSRGNAWIADNFLVGAQNQSAFWSGNLTELAPNGAPLSPMTTGFRGGGLLGPGFGLAIDAHDTPWVDSTSSNTISHFDAHGRPLSPPHGYDLGGTLGKMQGVIVTPSGDLWAVDSTKGTLVEIPHGDPARAKRFCVSPGGDPLKNPCKLRAPFHLAIDQQNRIWITNIAANWVTRFPANDPMHVTTFTAGYSGSGLAVDSRGNVWVTNRLGNSPRAAITTFDMLFAFKVNYNGDPDPADRVARVLVDAMAAQTPGRRSGGSVTVFRPDGTQPPFSPIAGAGIAAPWAVAIDGDDHVWVSNFNSATAGIVELCGVRVERCPPGVRTGQAISPPDGYVGGGTQMQVDVAIAPSGDVWVTNNWQDYPALFGRGPEALSTLGAGQGVVVFYGLATPVRTPLIGPPRQPPER